MNVPLRVVDPVTPPDGYPYILADYIGVGIDGEVHVRIFPHSYWKNGAYDGLATAEHITGMSSFKYQDGEFYFATFLV